MASILCTVVHSAVIGRSNRPAAYRIFSVQGRLPQLARRARAGSMPPAGRPATGTGRLLPAISRPGFAARRSRLERLALAISFSRSRTCRKLRSSVAGRLVANFADTVHGPAPSNIRFLALPAGVYRFAASVADGTDGSVADDEVSFEIK